MVSISSAHFCIESIQGRQLPMTDIAYGTAFMAGNAFRPE